MGEGAGASVRTVARSAAVLRALARGADRRTGGGMRLAEVTAAAGLGKSTAHRLLGALVEVGFVEFEPRGKLYRIGPGLQALGAAAGRSRIVALAEPALERLAQTTGDTVYLSVRSGDAALCVGRATGAYPIRTLTLDLGDRRPLGVGAGSLALLAFEPEAEVARVLEEGAAARAAYPGFDAATLARMVARTRRDGLAFNDGHIVAAMCALAVPVRDAAGRVVAALSIAAIRDRMAPDRRAGLATALRAEAAALERRLAEGEGAS